MKLEKSKKNHIVFGIGLGICIVCSIVSLLLPQLLHLYGVMTGADGLKNVIAAIILKYAAGLILPIPFLVFGIRFLVDIFKYRNLLMHSILFYILGVLFSAVVFPLLIYFGQIRTRFNVQKSNTDISGFFSEPKLCINCFSDLLTDDYDEFAINKCRVSSVESHTVSGGRGRSYHYEYEVTFYYDEALVAQMQIGNNDYDYFANLFPAEFDTKITVYKKSGFLRSVETSVEFERPESYEHFFTISLSDDMIVYEKNIGADLEGLQWSGFRKNESYDIQNEIFGIGVSEERPYLDAVYAGICCDEVCLYAIVDGQYRRVSNILSVSGM